MVPLLPNVDPEGLLEYSVVYSDRSLNHMSNRFSRIIRDVSSTLKEVYNAHSVATVPGGGTYAMEAVARQFATDKSCLVIRNGWFSYRWSQILERGSIPADLRVLKAQVASNDKEAPYAPPPVDKVTAHITAERPDLVFAPHVETSSGLLLPDVYLRTIAEAVHSVGGLFILDCVASGAMCIDMLDVGVDLLISAPQKGWSGSPGFGLVLLSAEAHERIQKTTSSSFACDLLQWLRVTEAYEDGSYAYHATMPTDTMATFHSVMQETEDFGFDRAREAQWELGSKLRSLLALNGFPSVAAAGYEAPTVVVSYTEDPEIFSGQKFAEVGVQIAAGVPLRVDEPDSFRTFRVGLFGLDKLRDVEGTVQRFKIALDKLS